MDINLYIYIHKCISKCIFIYTHVWIYLCTCVTAGDRVRTGRQFDHAQTRTYLFVESSGVFACRLWCVFMREREREREIESEASRERSRCLYIYIGVLCLYIRFVYIQVCIYTQAVHEKRVGLSALLCVYVCVCERGREREREREVEARQRERERRVCIGIGMYVDTSSIRNACWLVCADVCIRVCGEGGETHNEREREAPRERKRRVCTYIQDMGMCIDRSSI